MTLREWLLENFAGDLEYHPKRAYAYLGLGILAIFSWYFSSSETESTTLPLMFASGGVGLIGKAIFLFRKSSEGLGLTFEDKVALGEAAKQKKLASFSLQVAQIVQDFGVGVILLAFFVGASRNTKSTTSHASTHELILAGGCVFAVGWLVRWLIRWTNPTA